MANPAELLLDLFEQWDDQKKSAQAARFGSPRNPDFTAHRRAVHHLDAISEILKIMKADGQRVRPYEKAFAVWTRTVFAYPSGWGANSSGKIDATAKGHLETLINLMGRYVPAVEDTKLGELRAYLDAVGKALDADETVSKVVKAAAASVIINIRRCIEELNIVGEYDFKKSYDQLYAVIFDVHQASQDKATWKSFAENIVNPFVMGNLTGISAPLFSQLLQLS